MEIRVVDTITEHKQGGQLSSWVYLFLQSTDQNGELEQLRDIAEKNAKAIGGLTDFLAERLKLNNYEINELLKKMEALPSFKEIRKVEDA